MEHSLNRLGLIRVALCALLSTCMALPAWASEQVVTLTDGSRIRGEVVGLQDGRYAIDTAALGRVQVDAASVVSITAAEAAPAQPVSPGLQLSAGDAVARVQSMIADNPSLMSQILRLQTDPDMQAALSDPELMSAVQRFDIDALVKHPKFQALLNNPKIRAIQSTVK